MGLVVYCLFRRRTAKRRLHLFGKGNSSESFSANGLENISNDDLGAPSRANSNRRASDMDMSKALQEMTEQHQSALLSGKSSTLSLGQGAKAGNRMLSPTLSASRPYSQGTGYWTSPGAGLGIASNGESFIPAPMESSHDYRGSQYSDYYGVPSTPQHPPYFGAMGGSLDFNSNDQLLSPNHYLYRSGSPNNNVSRRSSLSPGSCPQPEGLRSQGPLFRAKTISTSSGHSYQASGHGTPYHSHPYPYYGYPPPGQAFHAISNTFTAESSSDDIYESDISRSTAEPHLFATATAGYDDMHGHNLVRPQSPNIAIMGNPADGYNTNGFVRPQSINKGVSPNIEIPPSITTRRRSANGQYASQGQSSYYQQQLQQNLHSISQEQSNLNRYPIAHPDKTQILDHEIETKDDKVGNIDGSGSGPGDVGQKASGKT
ncbi:hypothetical protein BGX26_008347 [Mortierella sp. AD094]|nr:hypothetical protein BGX26_008347 [Mortierella sp. AD094]